MTTSSPADDPHRNALAKALLPPLLFASKDDFKLIDRLTGVDGLVDGVLETIGAGERLARALRNAATGFDAADLDGKRARVTRMMELLRGVPVTPVPAALTKKSAPKTATTKPTSTKATAPPKPKPKLAANVHHAPIARNTGAPRRPHQKLRATEPDRINAAPIAIAVSSAAAR